MRARHVSPNSDTPRRESTDGTGGLDAALRALGDHVAAALESGSMRCGPYVLLERLGEGGYGEVFAAVRDDSIGRRVAVKILKRGLDTDEILRRFEMEQRALSRIDHPGVAAILDSGLSSDGRPWFAMPLLDGLPLTAECDHRRSPLSERLQLMAMICDGVQAAHVQGIVHRDLKPGNVLLVDGSDGRPAPKVIDFGIAKAIDPDECSGSARTGHGRRLGTPAYMAPEQRTGPDGGADVRTDVFALGVILAELASGVRPPAPSGEGHDGRLPMRASRLLKSLAMVDAAEADRVAATIGCTSARELVRALEGDIDAIVTKATTPEPEMRYQSAEAMAEDLRRMARSEPVLARVPSRTYVLSRFVRRNRRGVIAAAVMAIALISMSAVAMTSSMRAERSASLASQQAQRAEQVTGLLRGVFDRIDPEVAQGRDRTLLTEVLDDTLRRLNDESETLDPQAMAEVVRIVAAALVKLERPDMAIAALDAAMVRVERAIGDATGSDRERELRLERAAIRVERGSAIFESSWAENGVMRATLGEPRACLEWRSALDELADVGMCAHPVALTARLRLWRIREVWPEGISQEDFDAAVEADVEGGALPEAERWTYRLRKAENQPWIPLLRDYPKVLADCERALGRMHPIAVRARNRRLSFEVAAAIDAKAGAWGEVVKLWVEDEALGAQWAMASELSDTAVADCTSVFGPMHNQTLSARLWQLAAYGHLLGPTASAERYRALHADAVRVRGPDSALVNQVEATWKGVTEGSAAAKWW